MKSSWAGLHVPLITPLNREEKPDTTRLRTLINEMIDAGVDGVIVCGSTGEGGTLTPEEKEAVIEAAVEEVAGRVLVLSGSYEDSTDGSIRQGRRAAELGVDGVMVMAPYYSRVNQEETYTHFVRIADALPVGVMVYNNPGRSNINMDVDVLVRLGQHPNVMAIKESTGDTTRIPPLRGELAGQAAVLCGTDGVVLESLIAGADGWVSVAANVIPRQCVQLVRDARAGNWGSAQAVMDKIRPLVVAMAQAARGVQWCKGILQASGRSAGDPRAPLLPLGEEELQRVVALWRHAVAE